MFCHIVWTANGRRPEIGDLEQEIINCSFKLTFADLDVIPHAVGFMPDHVHVAVSIPPKAALSDLVRRMQGASSHALNNDTRRIKRTKCKWQDEYGALSFGEKALAQVISYINNQHEIHANRRPGQ